jgi:hypothetical protein
MVSPELVTHKENFTREGRQCETITLSEKVIFRK